MPTTFNVVSLGNLAEIDTVEGNGTAENNAALVGMTFGGAGDALVNDFVSFSPGSTGYTGGGSSTGYEPDNNNTNEAFSIDGGPDQIHDATTLYNATITYIDGTTASVTAVVFQDTAGNTYWAPEFSVNTDQSAMEAAAIRSITFDSVGTTQAANLNADRQTWNYVTCFAKGTMILTPDGEVAIEDLKAGDVVCTQDNGNQTIRWSGGREVPAEGKLAPILIKAGSLGNNLPESDLHVSRQHRLLCRSRVAKRMFDVPEVLISANKLVDLQGVRVDETMDTVTYCHILCDNHEVVYANGMPSETLYLGTQTKNSMSPEALAEIRMIFPELVDGTKDPEAVHDIPDNKAQRDLVRRLRKNKNNFVELH